MESSLTNLYVSNLPLYFNEELLSRLACLYGLVLRCRVGIRKQKSQDRPMSRPRRFGMIEYATGSQAERAKSLMDGIVINGYQLHVTWAFPSRENENGRPLTNVYFYHLPPWSTATHLNYICQIFGEIVKSRVVINNPRFPSLQNYGFVRFDTTENAIRAIVHLHGCVLLDGTQIGARFARVSRKEVTSFS